MLRKMNSLLLVQDEVMKRASTMTIVILAKERLKTRKKIHVLVVVVLNMVFMEGFVQAVKRTMPRKMNNNKLALAQSIGTMQCLNCWDTM